jgi:hypothetical protein
MTTASESCDTTSQMSLFGETCDDSLGLTLDGLYTTPSSSTSSHGQRVKYKQGGTPLGAQVMAGVSISSPQAIPASHSHSPGSDWARRMTATYGRKLSAYWLSCDPPDSWARTLLGISTWASTTCYLTWKKSVTPHGRLLFRLVPSMPRTAGIGFGLWGTPPSRDHKDVGDMTNVPENGLLGRQVLNDARTYPTPQARDWKGAQGRAYKGESMDLPATVSVAGLKLNSAWVSRMMGYPDNWLDLTPDGEATP